MVYILSISPGREANKMNKNWTQPARNIHDNMGMKPELTPNSSQEMDSGWYHLSSIHTETKAATILENAPWEAQLPAE